MAKWKDFRFDWSEDPKLLRKTCKELEFDETFYSLIRKSVIDVLSPQLIPEPHNLVYDDDKVYQYLISPLEQFICDGPQDQVRKTMSHLEKLEQPDKMCRKVMKTGDVLFSCNDCGFDGTCVVCIDCFHKSEHKNHNYRMSNTDGGGCCDCGDVEAWKQYPACSDHMTTNQLNLKISDFEDKEKREEQCRRDQMRMFDKMSLIEDQGIITRFFIVCQASLHYARQMLSWNAYTSLPSNLRYHEKSYELKHLLSDDRDSNNYFTVLFNDEVHTYDHVINTLVKIIKCSKMTASIMASTVSREGRSLILQGPFGICWKAREAIVSMREAGQEPLKVEVYHGSVLAHQAYALKLIEWVKKMSTVCDAFRILTAYTLLGGYEPDPVLGEDPKEDLSLLEKVMLLNTQMWKIARIEWNDLFVATLLTEYNIKERFARLTTRLYPRLIDDYLEDDHDHSVSAMTMTTQLYTGPSLICMLIEEEDALSVIARTLVKVCKLTRRDNTSILRYASDNLRRGYSIISDFKHLINIEPTLWTPKLRENVINAVKIFLELLSSMQSMDSVRRQLGQHLEYEPEWETGITLQMRLIPLISRLVTYCAYDEKVLTEVLRETQQLLFKNGSFKRISRELMGHQASCIHYDVSISPVSVHLPLTRFASALIIELMRRKPCDTIPYDESLVILVENNSARDTNYYLRATQSETSASRQHSMIDIMEQSLRTEVMVAQFRSGMWRRNGSSLINQILYFTGAMMRKEMFDRDILCIQECAATCEANKFILHLLNKFNLFPWANYETAREPVVGPKAVSFYNDEEILAQTMSLGEEFLQLLLTVVSERYRVGIGKVNEEDVMKNEIIQLLCIQPYTRSEIEQKLQVNDHDLHCIKSVANLRRSTENSTAKYELKEECYPNFNPFFYHYNRRQQSLALDAQLKRKRNLKHELICCPPPKPVELTDQFKNLNELLKCELTLMIIQKNLRRAIGPTDNVQECPGKAPIRFTASDLQLDQCLHLIGLGLYEQERDPIFFSYLMAAHNANIFSTLKDCYEKAQRSKDLIQWIFLKANALIEHINAIHANNLDEQQSRVYSEILDNIKPILSKCDTVEQEDKKRSKESAAKRRERITAMMKARQDKFLANPVTKQLEEETAKYEAPIKHYPVGMATSTTNTTTTTTASSDNRAVQNENEEEKMEVVPSEPDSRQCVGLTKFCIVCREEQYVTFDGPSMVLLAFIQRSTVLSKNRERKIPYYSLTPSNQLKYLISADPDLKLVGGYAPEKYSYTSDNSWSFDATYMPSDLFFGPHVSTCGHVMHYNCWQGFTDAVTKRETSRPNRAARHASFELEKNEILCPLCDCVSNAVIPILPSFDNFALDKPKTSAGVGVFCVQPKKLEYSSDNLATFLHAIKSTVAKFKHVRHLHSSSGQQPASLHSQRQMKKDHEEKYARLLQPAPINEALNELDEAEALALRDFIAKISAEKISSSMLTKNLLGIISNLAERIIVVGLDLDKSIVDINHERVFMMTSWAIAYTIHAQERCSRFKGTPLFDDSKSDRYSALTYLIRYACASMMTIQSDMIQNLLVRKLRYLLISEEHLMSSPCCLDIDSFELFISIFIMLQKLYSHMDDTSAWTTCSYDHEFFRNLLHLTLILNMLQVIISMQGVSSAGDDEEMQDSSHEISDECIVLHNFYNDVIMAAGHPNSRMPPRNELLVKRTRRALLPFLRSCAIFFSHLSNLEPSDLLKTQISFNDSYEENQEESLKASDIEFEAICDYLSLPNSFALLLKNQESRNLARLWLHHSRVLLLIKSSQSAEQQQGSSSSSGSKAIGNELMPLKLIRQPHRVNRLIDLPHDYSELVDKVSNFTCPSIKNEDSRTPTMCLVCGAMLCSQSYCCQRDLNDLAANYQQVVRRQDEIRQKLLAEVQHYRRLGKSQVARRQQQQREQDAASGTGQADAEPVAAAAAAAATVSVSLRVANFASEPYLSPVVPTVPAINQQLVGSCTYHAHECSGGVGIFLRIRNCQILLLSNKTKGCYLPAPYVDDHGETDYGLLRGNPMHLDQKQYERWQQKWMSHEIPEKISRFLEHSPNASNINWYLH